MFARIFFALVFVLIAPLLLYGFRGVLRWTFISVQYLCAVIEWVFISMCDFANFFQYTLNEEQPIFVYHLTNLGYIETEW